MDTSEFKVKSEDLIRKIRELIEEGNVNRIIIKDGAGKVYLEIRCWLLLVPWLPGLPILPLK